MGELRRQSKGRFPKPGDKFQIHGSERKGKEEKGKKIVLALLVLFP